MSNDPINIPLKIQGVLGPRKGSITLTRGASLGQYLEQGAVAGAHYEHWFTRKIGKMVKRGVAYDEERAAANADAYFAALKARMVALLGTDDEAFEEFRDAAIGEIEARQASFIASHGVTPFSYR